MNYILQGDSTPGGYERCKTFRRTITVNIDDKDQWKLQDVKAPEELKNYDVLRLRCHLSVILEGDPGGLEWRVDEWGNYCVDLDVDILEIKPQFK